MYQLINSLNVWINCSNSSNNILIKIVLIDELLKKLTKAFSHYTFLHINEKLV